MTYTADWAKVTVAEVVMTGPNAMPIAFIERLTGEKPPIANRIGTMVDVAQFVASIDDTAPFYTELLGYTCAYDDHLPDGLIDEVVALPPGTRSRMCFLLRPGSSAPAVELIECSARGQSLAGRAHPLRFGLFGLAFETPDLRGLLAAIRARGYQLDGGPVEIDTPTHGRIETAVVRGPNHVLLEFFERG